MPELPEVETIINGLRHLLVNKTFFAIEIIDYDHKINGDLNALIGKEIISMGRFGKYLIFNFSNHKTMLVHLRMTGQFIFENLNMHKLFNHDIVQPDKQTKLIDDVVPSIIPPINDSKKSSHTKIKFYLKDDQDNTFLLRFNDWRKFGTVDLMDTSDLTKFFIDKGLGPDALSPDLNFQTFSKLLFKRGKSRIKTTLMDQKVISGLGNIYAQEVCFFAGILPDRKIENLTLGESKLLFDGIKAILLKAIEFNGTSFDTAYVTSNGTPGNFSDFLRVYMIKRCKVCNTNIKNMRLSSRSSYYCPNCQR